MSDELSPLKSSAIPPPLPLNRVVPPPLPTPAIPVMPLDGWVALPLPHRVGTVNLMLHISAALYVCIGALMPSFMEFIEPDGVSGVIGKLMLFACLFLAIAVECLTWAVRARKSWAWVACFAVMILYTSSLFMPLGLIGLWALFDRGTRAELKSPMDS